MDRTGTQTLICDDCLEDIPDRFTRYTHNGGQPLCFECWRRLYGDQEEDLEDVLEREEGDRQWGFEQGII